MPTKTGTLVLHDTGITGGRGDDFSAVAGVTLTPSPELAAFLHTTRFVVTVDGVAQDASAGFGPTDYDVFPQLSSGPGLQAVTPCSKPGKHTIEVRAEVAGSTAPIAAATIEWDAVCPALPRSVSDVTEPAPPRAMGQAEPSSSSSGCSVGASNASGALPLLGALVGLVVAARRRKARR